MTRAESYEDIYEQLARRYHRCVAAILAADVLHRRAAALRGADTKRLKGA